MSKNIHQAQFWPSRLLASACGFFLLLTAAACSAAPDASLGPPDGVVWSLETDIHAATVAVGGTQQLIATPRRIDGSVAAGVPVATFTSTDASVTVTPNGLVTGADVNFSPVAVIATVYTDGITFADTTFVGVTATAHTIKKFTIHPVLPDSAKLPQDGYKSIPLIATDSNDVPLLNLSVNYKALDPNYVQVSFGSAAGTQRGTGRIVASTTSYGVTRTDTVEYTVTYPVQANVTCYSLVSGQKPFGLVNAIIGVGGTVWWNNRSLVPISILFDNGGTGIPNGNIVGLGDRGIASRTFPVAGTYSYKDQLGNTAKVTVLPEN